MKINRYYINPNTKKEDLIDVGFKSGGSWIIDDAVLFKTYDICNNISISIAFTENILDFNDFDNILVIDEDFGQPYTPFYGDNYGKDIKNKFIQKIIIGYNKFLDSLPFLIKEEKRIQENNFETLDK